MPPSSAQSHSFISILIIIVLHTYLVQSSLFYIYLQEDRRLLSTTSLRYAAWSWIERYRSAEELFCCHIFGGKFPLLIVVVFLSHITRWAASLCRRAKVWSITQFYYVAFLHSRISEWKKGGMCFFPSTLLKILCPLFSMVSWDLHAFLWSSEKQDEARFWALEGRYFLKKPFKGSTTKRSWPNRCFVKTDCENGVIAQTWC